MFATNALPPPSNFANVHRPLRLTGEPPRVHPVGGCHSILLHPSAQNQRCACQSFHHNRSAPGDLCDCGHHACYHVHQPSEPDRQQHHDTISRAAENALLERIRRLEETLQHEREIREAAMQRERHLWEREVRILREALAPFYKSEQEMRRKLVELEDRVEGNYDEQIRMRDTVVTLDDANMALERRVEEMEGARNKKRRISRRPGQDDNMTNGHVVHDMRRVSSNVDETSVRSSSSRALSPNSVFQPLPEPEEPRSSGILNLADAPRSTPQASTRRVSPAQEEPRSSGFLALDLAERRNARKLVPESPPELLPNLAQMLVEKDRSLPAYARSNPDGAVDRWGPNLPPLIANGVSKDTTPTSLPNLSPRKRKTFIEHVALEVLADVSVANPLIH